MTHRFIVVSVLVVLIALISVGCMTHPQNGDLLESPTQGVLFGGSHLTPGIPVLVEAFHPGTGNWDAIAETTVRTKPFLVPGGWSSLEGPLYAWKVEASVPTAYWEGWDGSSDSQTIYRARVRAVSPGSNGKTLLFSTDTGSVPCFFSHDSSVLAFAAYCALAEPNVTTIYTTQP